MDSYRDKVVKLFRGRCLIVPAHKGTEVHEIVPRSQRPKTWNKLENQVLLCRNCHAKIHADGARNWVDFLIEKRKDWLEKYVQ